MIYVIFVLTYASGKEEESLIEVNSVGELVNLASEDNPIIVYPYSENSRYKYPQLMVYDDYIE